ncbi:histidine phosphatase family protein [Magnetospirillum sp. SS-4]|uniref:histidine phosphatase family protein n=1 Tax=Magnetospirillum sp. SS-4 TaxID=2681465 RepID=UPI0013817729|nr:histidine phosphatase family protein [Magnetospirillum sp. SS-4]CAA7623545.1 Fructose-2,6-bisphosphatase [Magnetospirillum sp. SS-4]
MPTIILIRHGETEFNREGRIQGHADSPLTLKGTEQAFRHGLTVRRLMDDHGGDWRVVSSPLGRCVQTTAILCAAAGLDTALVGYDHRLKEVDTGSLAGRLKSDLAAELRDGTGLDHWVFKSPDGESHATVSARLASWLAERRPGERVICVSHGIAGRVLRGLYLGQSPAEALRGDSPQDAVFVLKAGAIRRVAC